MDYWGEIADAEVPVPEYPDTRTTVDRAYGAQFAGYPGAEREVHEAPVHWAETATGATSDGWWGQVSAGIDPDYSVGGVPASPTGLPYSEGVVTTSNVENFELTGRIVRPGRDRESAPGPVGATEYRSALIMQIVQSMGPDVTQEMAAIGLLTGI